MAMLDAEGRSDITNVLQHCHGGKGIFNNILLLWDKVGPLLGGLENVPRVKPNQTPKRHKKRRTRLSAPAVAIQLVMCNTCSVITLSPTVLSDR